MGRKGGFSIKVHCNKCKEKLYHYWKDKGGELLKCYVDEITKDFTNGELKCPKCGEEFARLGTVHNRPANIIIRGKVYVKGHHG